MSYVFNMVGGGSGSGDVYAFIVVSYPAGSTCTASNGTTTLTAPDTSGSWVCKVPNAGTWTVTATDGTDIASANVSITTEGQSENVSLSYGLYLVKNGSIILAQGGAAYPATVTETGDTVRIAYSGAGSAYSNVALWGLTSEFLGGKTFGYLNAHVLSWSGVSNDDYSRLGVSTSNTPGTSSVAAKKAYGNSFPETIKISVDSISLANKFVFIQVSNASGTCVIDNLWLSED